MNTKHFNAAVKFGEQLLKTNDLDPVYVAIHEARLKWDQRARLVLAYSCLYHLGAAAHLSETKGTTFWGALMLAARNDAVRGGRWPRGSERRHWRGLNAIKTVEYLSTKYETPEQVIGYWMDGGVYSFQGFTNRVKETPSFGPWIAFKMADMLERVLEYDSLELKDCELGIYDEPRRGAALIRKGNQDEPISPAQIQDVCGQLARRLRAFQAPPLYDRALNIMEIETILCKYKSMVNGHYHVGKDINEIRHGLRGPWGATAQHLLKAAPPEVTI